MFPVHFVSDRKRGRYMTDRMEWTPKEEQNGSKRAATHQSTDDRVKSTGEKETSREDASQDRVVEGRCA